MVAVLALRQTHSPCGRRLPDQRELGWIRMIRYSKGQKFLDTLDSKRKLAFCICPTLFIKSEWLRAPLKAKTVLVFYYRDNLDRAVSILNEIPHWLERKKPTSDLEKTLEITLRRITKYGDELLYGCVWWPAHPELTLGDVIEYSPAFLRLWSRAAPLHPPERLENRPRRELESLALCLSMFLESQQDPFPTYLEPQTEAVEKMTAAYNRVGDDYLGDPYEVTGDDPDGVEIDEDYLHEYEPFFDLSKWTDDQLLNLEHVKALKLQLMEEQAFEDGLFEYIPWPPIKPNRFYRRTRADVCLRSPESMDPTTYGEICKAAQKCWDALFLPRGKRV